MVEVASPAVRGDSRPPRLVVVDVRRQLVEARERAFDQDMHGLDVKTSSLPLVGGSYGPTWALLGRH